ncbi:GCN5-related N-acetyltransferase [Leptothrix cholodnii SP-6]|uniref:GCN5-related N-acetyltransferase n=1 Tax=Leptothrix cholodnii (strain ATCC 51168 / LMG 8142 / SP-6) TaxID=395495 RepID=B1Y574_LEPCP|nr:GNAT family N-acetyltransferase [Leptothrix cholodnii]ACB32304.1 GCN5-related N-acetyltransferase [Leptothrix cholodnii SP-6]
MITIDSFTDADQPAWQELARAYKAFYLTGQTDSEYQATWQRLRAGEQVHGWAARLDGRLVGIVHCLFHASAWTDDVCYLQDLFVAEAARGQGVAAALIERVAQAARERGAPRLYWLTQDHNARARALYDRVAQNRGFIRYDYVLGPT